MAHPASRGPRPVRPPRVSATLAETPGRFRDSARRALRPFREELAGTGPGANARPGKRGPELRGGVRSASTNAAVERRKAWRANARRAAAARRDPQERLSALRPPRLLRGDIRSDPQKRNSSAGTGEICQQIGDEHEPKETFEQHKAGEQDERLRVGDDARAEAPVRAGPARAGGVRTLAEQRLPFLPQLLHQTLPASARLRRQHV